MELSKRLQAIADLIRYQTVADIGTDHGYIPIALHKMGRITKAYACDIGKGPLAKAKTNIKAEQAEEVIETRLGDGLLSIQPNEAESIVMAGMGGILMVEILHQSPEVLREVKECILSPHSDVPLVRKTLHEVGFIIETERMIKEDGKYYSILRAIHGQEKYHKEIEYLYGKILLDSKNTILLEWMQEQKKKIEQILKQLQEIPTDGAKGRMEEMQKQLEWMKEAMRCLSHVER